MLINYESAGWHTINRRPSSAKVINLIIAVKRKLFSPNCRKIKVTVAEEWKTEKRVINKLSCNLQYLAKQHDTCNYEKMPGEKAKIAILSNCINHCNAQHQVKYSNTVWPPGPGYIFISTHIVMWKNYFNSITRTGEKRVHNSRDWFTQWTSAANEQTKSLRFIAQIE